MITLVTGGSGSGKSEYAEGLILDSPLFPPFLCGYHDCIWKRGTG